MTKLEQLIEQLCPDGVEDKTLGEIGNVCMCKRILILDENNVKRFEDYSYDTASYDDNQTSVINFEIPTDIKDYVADKISGSEGLQFSRDGKVTGYTGTDDFVIIPEYKVINGTVIKVTGIAKNAFKGKVKLQNGTDEFLGIELSEYITEIEDGAFEGCSALKYINFKNVTSIGENAFAGCESLKVAQLNDNVTHLGDNAFENLDALLIYAANKSVAESAVKSGAKAIALIVSDKCADFEDVTLEVPTGTGFFGFYGSNSTPRNFKDVSIVSNADETLILNANFEFTKNNPITISSETVTWGESNVYSPYFCVMFTSENTNLSVYGESTFYSQKGDAILTRDLTLSGIEDELYSQYHMNGNVLVCGEVTDNGNLSFISGQVITISEDEFTKYLKGTYIVTFDPNGGMVDTDSKTIFFGSEYGELPIPTRDGCEFLGWYQGDTQITSDMIPTKAEDVTLKARWQSSWVLAENLPADGQTNDDKWSYTEREYSNSGSSTMTGWTKYDTKRTSWGATQGPVYSNPNNGSRNVWSEQYKIRDNYKTVWHYSRSITGPSGWNSYSVNISPNEGYLAYTQYITLDYQLSLYDENWKGLGKRYGQYYHDGFDCPYWFNEWSESVYVNTDYGTRWYYQDPIYTYYYYRDVDKESTSEITAGGDISNVQHWVKYIVK